MQHHVIVIGGGFSGIGAAILLDKAGLSDYLVLEEGDGVGGAWHWNTYPGVAVDIPLLHLGDVVAEAAKAKGAEAVALLGTRFAMSRSFFTDRIASHGLTVHVPDERHHDTVNRIIYDELVHEKVLDGSRRTVVGLIDELWDAGAGGVILGCTELELLVRQADADIPVFPCTTLHVAAALDRALA